MAWALIAATIPAHPTSVTRAVATTARACQSLTAKTQFTMETRARLTHSAIVVAVTRESVKIRLSAEREATWTTRAILAKPAPLTVATTTMSTMRRPNTTPTLASANQRQLAAFTDSRVNIVTATIRARVICAATEAPATMKPSAMRCRLAISASSITRASQGAA